METITLKLTLPANCADELTGLIADMKARGPIIMQISQQLSEDAAPNDLAASTIRGCVFLTKAVLFGLQDNSELDNLEKQWEQPPHKPEGG